MMKTFLLLVGAALLLTAIFLPAQAAEGDVVFAGEVSYRERIALPDQSGLRVTLVNLDNANAPIVSASSLIARRGQVPLQFSLNVRSNVLRADGHYGLIAEIIAGGAVQFRNPVPVTVPASGSALVGILVNFDPQPPEPEPSAMLLETIWHVRSIEGASALPATKLSLSIASDRRAGGHGGCNDYFTEAALDGQTLMFGPVAGTRMACAMDVMAQEAAFFATLGEVRGYDVAPGRLYLLDAEGGRLMHLVRGQ